MLLPCLTILQVLTVKDYYCMQREGQHRYYIAVFLAVFFHGACWQAYGLSGVFSKKAKQVLHNDYCYKNISEISDMTTTQCSLACLTDCLCLSHQLCGKVCQLCSSSAVSNPEDMRSNEECDSYHLVTENTSQTSNHTELGCCASSQPCPNWSACHPSVPTGMSRRRYGCVPCPDGYHGDRCQTPIKSCRGYAKRNVKSGKYVIIDGDGLPLRVFCDFDNKTSWTLVQSHDVSNRLNFRETPLFKDIPSNNGEPSWRNYRLSLSQMTSIRSDSTKWRVTCQYDTEGVVYTDYISGFFEKLDILHLNSLEKVCRDFEYIDIRGQTCSDACNTCIFQSPKVMLHMNLYHCTSCTYKSVHAGLNHADYFGYYEDDRNTEHRCSSDADATTQIWFAGPKEACSYQ